MDISVILAFVASFITVLVVTPFVIKFAVSIGATDKPNERKVHQKLMPRLGGLAIFIGVLVGYFVGGLYSYNVTAITAAGIVILLTGFLDDKYELAPKYKLLGQIVAASIVVSSGLTIELLYVPFVGEFSLGLLGYPITFFWIIAITNAINLIDGLDGLAAGISGIVIATIAILAAFSGNMLILTISVILLGSIIGFLFYNFNPAKIFMGDTGALFLGYCISILSLLGLYKSVTLFSFVVPIIILGVPIFDTTFAIIRRIVNKRPISSPDKEHLHHRLLSLGLSHRNTVLMIYCLSIFFSVTAVAFSSTTMWGAILITFVLLIILELLAESIGLVSQNYKPIINMYSRLSKRRI
ncbi:UDP-GlcNAc:undecaprenyl-phosphate GlcNAc-1-phosphate transferase [Bacillus mesophilus]|uniref:Undecaprenyl/decaprenyl-phosphate alpha-N-acetylglucosaminyl 1-phosphate transferase n=1 Tax=Bacillus mesophilus TaxID=1808955 RepID=A0A6M0Q963_9BACI|nr:MraY family glycosyltransferase [Bacillus mesophilus]MBM7661620.1 UDP-GlcNAc:undecaprenyl-phosphate GlcNAc-1-phosphate transferase [Bacillus mesophilus]NEY72289.1 undecaprenyl/decaprenyl-phosphate alpha-N-acetylglucosaminyl 1-phosphate transferase [Bacillus mesophilus]